jgi:hypothetical protein
MTGGGNTGMVQRVWTIRFDARLTLGILAVFRMADFFFCYFV